MDAGGLNPAAVFDTHSGGVVLHYASGCNSVTLGAKGMCTFQLLCTAWGCRGKRLVRGLGGAAFSASDCVVRGDCNGVSPGPGNGAQLTDGPHKGRLIFAGHLGTTIALGDTAILHCRWLPLAVIPWGFTH